MTNTNQLLYYWRRRPTNIHLLFKSTKRSLLNGNDWDGWRLKNRQKRVRILFLTFGLLTF